LPSLLFSLNSYTATLGSFVLAVIPGCYRKEAAFSRYPRSVLVFSIPYQHWPSTHGTLHLVHRLALLFQVGRHHGCLGVPSSFKVTFYLREEPTALSPSLDHTITFVQSGSRKILTIPLSIVVGIPNLSLNVNLCRFFSFSFPGSLDTGYGGRPKSYETKNPYLEKQ